MVQNKSYRNRIVDELLKKQLESSGAVLIEGPKWCGKTTTAEQHAQSILYMDDPRNLSNNIRMASLNPDRLLNGDTPRLIDEWQIAPELWDAVRFRVDHREGLGQFILTGSAVPPDRSKIHHTGTGRFSWLTMRPMTLWESGESSGEVSLTDLFCTPALIDGGSLLSIEDLAFVICRGGWPQATKMNKSAALIQAFNYYDAVVNNDISRIDGVRRSPERVKRLMRSLARFQGTQTSIESIRRDMIANEAEGMDCDTVQSYLDSLNKIFVTENTHAWNPNLRSKTAIRTSDTRYFADPSIGIAALGIGPNDLLNDLNTMGLLFETLAVRDLRVYAQAIGGEVYHYRDSNGLECDAVIHLRNGNYGLVEIKLGGESLIAEGKKTLNKLASSIDTTKMKNPSFRMVLIGVGNFAYRDDDGTYVVPIGCLKP
ncbi:MAG: ATP-binding protein [Fibrobacter sp.]|nr:ATP-binding protein [Fibrobacter sp.]